ncbi:MAG: GNAT family N-acetyltransferase [Kiloniellales bacterium]
MPSHSQAKRMMTHTFDAALEEPEALDHVGASELRSVTISSFEAFQALRDELEELCGDLCEENVFYEPWMVKAALTHLDGKRTLSFVCFYEQAGQGRLCGFFPLMRAPVHPLLPLQTYQSWRHAHCFRCTPLIRKGFAQLCWDGLFTWLEQQPAWRRMLHLRSLPADGEVERALRSVLERRAALRHAVLDHESAFLNIDPEGEGDSEKVLRQAMSGNTLGKLRRQQRRLAESG